MKTRRHLRLVTAEARPAARARPLEPRAHTPVYHPGEGQRCPSCSGRNWHVGRIMAECGFCSTALPVAEGAQA